MQIFYLLSNCVFLSGSAQPFQFVSWAYTPSWDLLIPVKQQLYCGRVSPGPHSLSEAMKITAPWSTPGAALQLTAAGVSLGQHTRLLSRRSTDWAHFKLCLHNESLQSCSRNLKGDASFPETRDHATMPLHSCGWQRLVILHKKIIIIPPLTLILAESCQKDSESKL